MAINNDTKMPSPPAQPEQDFDSAEYPLAVEYHGPPVKWGIPMVMPVGSDQLKLAPAPDPNPRKVTRWSPKVFIHRAPETVEVNGGSSLICPSPAPSSPLACSSTVPSPSSYGESPVWIPGGEVRVRRKSSCRLCGKGNRYTKKEWCIVCEAKYCGECVLRAMGSMLEGRKCLGCVGKPIDEARRRGLGRTPRVLGMVLPRREVKEVMRVEKESEVNRLRPETVFVNGKPIQPEEMAILQACEHPPEKLSPGRYWYDNASGLWGLEGRKPHKLITSNLNVGGGMHVMASNGDSGILVNGRIITKSERYLLMYAGVQDAGNPHLWLDANGDYREEGQRNIQGNLWRKPGTKLVCCALSLPFPSKATETWIEANKVTYNSLPSDIQKRLIKRLFLVRCHGSGASTIFNQAKFLYKGIPFTEDERKGIKVMIQCNTYRYFGVLLEGREQFEEESLMHGSDDETQENAYAISPRLREFSDWFLEILHSGNLEVFFPASNREYFPLVEKLWKSTAIQATYNRRHELQNLASSASYFLEQVLHILDPEYEVRDQDIIHTDWNISSNGVSHIELCFPTPDGDDSSGSHVLSSPREAIRRYELIMVNIGWKNKWLDMFEDINIVIFCVALTDYNEHYKDADGTFVNKMLANKTLFETVATHPLFCRKNFLLVLNKFDLLEQKIEREPLTLCDWFSDFNPVKIRRRGNEKYTPSAEQAYHYIAFKFKMLFTSLTDRRLYVISTSGLDRSSVDNMFRHAKNIIFWEEEKSAIGADELSGDNSSPSSPSY